MTDFKALDPTACGLFLVAIVSLPLALANLTTTTQGPTPVFFDIMGALILLVAVAAWRAESNFGFTVFLLVGAAVLLTGLGMGGWANVAFGIIFLMTLIWSVFAKTPKALTLILLMTALIFIIVGVQGINGSDLKMALGVVALLNFILNFYLSFALATEKVPVF